MQVNYLNTDPKIAQELNLGEQREMSTPDCMMLHPHFRVGYNEDIPKSTVGTVDTADNLSDYNSSQAVMGCLPHC